MNLYLLKQDTNNNWDTFDSLVVAAETKKIAKLISPCEEFFIKDQWTKTKNVKVTLIGITIEETKQGIILASFHAG